MPATFPEPRRWLGAEVNGCNRCYNKQRSDKARSFHLFDVYFFKSVLNVHCGGGAGKGGGLTLHEKRFLLLGCEWPRVKSNLPCSSFVTIVINPRKKVRKFSPPAAAAAAAEERTRSRDSHGKVMAAVIANFGEILSFWLGFLRPDNPVEGGFGSAITEPCKDRRFSRI